jgi:thiol-disulfide isomerase/thioredoxin
MMNRKVFFAIVAITVAFSTNLFAQDKMVGANGQLGVGTMLSPPAAGSADSMMRATGTDNGGSMAADPRTGSMLRTAGSTGNKVLFSTLDAAEALAAKGPTVLMFAADWCPICQADLKDINANGSRLGNIAIVVVDYDKAAELKSRYGITVQHIYVQIDAKGKKLAIWSGGGVDGILSHVDKM